MKRVVLTKEILGASEIKFKELSKERREMISKFKPKGSKIASVVKGVQGDFVYLSLEKV